MNNESSLIPDHIAPNKMVINANNYTMEVVMRDGWRTAIGLNFSTTVLPPSFDLKITDKYLDERTWNGLDAQDFCHILFNHFGVNESKKIGLARRVEVQEEMDHLSDEHEKLLKKVFRYQKQIDDRKKVISTARRSKEFRKALRDLRESKNDLAVFHADCSKHGYPLPPPPSLTVDDSKRGVANGNRFPGIYFIYDGSDIIYIGKSIDVFSRTYSHTNGEASVYFGKRFSFLPFPEKELLYIEAFYIGVLRPKNNFGSWK